MRATKSDTRAAKVLQNDTREGFSTQFIDCPPLYRSKYELLPPTASAMVTVATDNDQHFGIAGRKPSGAYARHCCVDITSPAGDGVYSFVHLLVWVDGTHLPRTTRASDVPHKPSLVTHGKVPNGSPNRAPISFRPIVCIANVFSRQLHGHRPDLGDAPWGT